MNLNLSVNDDRYKRHSVIHEFGHALGLRHEHQRSDFWENIESCIDKAKMIEDLKCSEAELETNWTSQHFPNTTRSEYDPESIMHYWYYI